MVNDFEILTNDICCRRHFSKGIVQTKIRRIIFYDNDNKLNWLTMAVLEIKISGPLDRWPLRERFVT